MLFPAKPLSWIARLAAMVMVACVSASACAEDTRRRSMELFEKHVRPTLVEHCIRCHGPKKQQGGLRLDTREGWAKGGDSGAAIVPGQAESLLLRAISYEDVSLEMPPRGKLPEKTVAAFDDWVALGAIDPRETHKPDRPQGSADESEADGSAWQRSVEAGAPDVEAGRAFWSFQPVKRPAVPPVADNDAGADWARSDIDRFIYARLHEAGLTPVEDAEATVLLRRLYYDLIGLPPTPSQIDDFLRDPSPAAYEALVDRLLDSHHFGERWGRHWLDVVRFAESSGGGRTLMFPNAWRYRDYVIDSFNRDLPYDRFLIEQIAGDLLECDDWQQKARNLTATAFLLLGPINYEMQDKDILEMDIVDEQLDTIGKSLMGMTIGCARCHDHKFDPIPADDYYAMAGVLKSTNSVVHSNVSKWNTVDLPVPPEQERVFDEYQAKLDALKKSHKEANQRWIDAGGKSKEKADDKSIDPSRIAGVVLDDTDAEMIGSWTSSTSIASFVGASYIHDATEGKGQKQVIYRPKLPAAGRYEVFISYSASSNRSSKVPIHVHHAGGESIVRVDQKKLPSVEAAFESLGDFELDPADNPYVIISNEGTQDGVVIADSVFFVSADRSRKNVLRGIDSSPPPQSPEQQQRIAELQKEVSRLGAEIKKLEKNAPQRPVVMATVDAGQVGDIHLAIRGQAHQKGPLVTRGVMQVASWEPFPEITAEQSGRKELAEWIADPRHPLTARVMANRVWYWLTGRGIVPTVDNFGTMGETPTHPELLDYLASTFIDRGWSVKQLIREIVLSRVYRLSSSASERGLAVDPSNRLFWRMNRKRLRAEDIRDTLLAVAGNLDHAYGGSNIRPGTTIEYGYQFTSTRRSVYVPVFRNRLPEIFEVFDFADPNIQRGRRNVSTVASQALWMMNHPMVAEQSQLAARRLLAQSLAGTDSRIRHAYFQVLGRPPTDPEYAVAVDLLDAAGQNGNDGETSEAPEESEQRWAMLYHVLFQCLDFRYLD